MAIAPSQSPESVERRVTASLEPLFTNQFRVIYDPAFPLADGSTFPWFQVIFAIGPADDAAARTQVHERFVQLLTALAPLPEVQRAKIFSLRARRHVPHRTPPDQPQMFIECAWHGSVVADIQRAQSFSAWHSHCYSYVNRFDRHDPLNTNDRSA